MGNTRAVSQLKQMPDQLKKLLKVAGSVNSFVKWAGSVDTGAHAGTTGVLIDLDNTTWADNNRRVIILAVPGESILPSTMKTQSHAAGQFIDGSFSFQMYLENPEDWTGAQAQFVRCLQTILVGQNAAPCEIFFGTNDVEPRVEGVNGATSGNEVSSGFVSGGIMLPYSLSYSGGI